MAERGSVGATRTQLPRQDGSERGPPRSWDNFSHWVCCVCVVTFDLELGQALETVLPDDYQLSDTEKSNICYLSFPDSNSGGFPVAAVCEEGAYSVPLVSCALFLLLPSRFLASLLLPPLLYYPPPFLFFALYTHTHVGCMGDTQFHFRVRCSGPGAGGSKMHHTIDHHGAPLVLMPDPGYYYGFVFFRQVRDSDIRRGYFQKSVVILTRLPYITFFSQVLQKIAPDYFTNGLPSLETACYSINQWPPPRPGQVLQLPLLGQLIHVRIPTKSDRPGSTKILETDVARRSPATVIIPSVHDLNLFQALQPLLSNFELVWELVITNEPVVVIASSPTLCAHTVQALVSLIHPLKYASDYRPFFTIHDSEFKHYTTRTQAPPQVILGVTNPFFSKMLDQWPHIIRIGDLSGQDEVKLPSRSRSPGETTDSKPGVHTKYKPFLHKDKTFTKLIAATKTPPGKRPMEVQNMMIKKHALELTTSFIIPLERYLASLMPLKRDVSPWRPPPQLKPFNIEQFLKGMEGAGPHLTSGIKGNWAGLYRRFLSSPNFVGWFSVRKEEANQKLRLLHLDMLCKADMNFWMREKEEVEIVDFLIQVKDCMANALRHYPSVPSHTLQALQGQIRTIVSKLPEDLQSCLKPSFMQ